MPVSRVPVTDVSVERIQYQALLWLVCNSQSSPRPSPVEVSILVPLVVPFSSARAWTDKYVNCAQQLDARVAELVHARVWQLNCLEKLKESVTSVYPEYLGEEVLQEGFQVAFSFSS